jgi:demethylmenaquinone methyltransferase/2-methoxy-6-polyprenyl-1,4-benzoquinol methylase
MGFALRHVADLEALFTEIRRVLKPGGTACILELTQPRSRLASVPLRLFMTRVVPFAARIARRPDAGRLITFYWDTIEACVRPEAVIGALARAGFEHPERHVSVGLFSEYVSRR